MSSLKSSFSELMERIRQGRELGHASFEPIYYLVFSPSQILDVKRHMPAWTAKLKNDGWSVHFFPMADHIAEILGNAPLRKIWLTEDGRSPTDWQRTNRSLANALARGELQSRLERKLMSIQGEARAILLVTDLEALHPYLRIGVIERALQGKFNIPTVFFYPGKRTGKARLKFLGFYQEDGNYRSVHVGG
ncbi:MAG: BREX protein BrxB domain-containing protein [Thermodesulfobacteriota bacterium]